MIVCPSCTHYSLEGTIFCNNCGSRLVYTPHTPEETASHPVSNAFPPTEVAEVQTYEQPSIFKAAVIIEEGDILLPLEIGKEYTLGRISGNQPILPDIDLTPYQAYERGVSRLHATLKIMKNGLTITDLGSANGSRINGQKIPSHVPLVLANGDIVALGKFKLQILLRK